MLQGLTILEKAIAVGLPLLAVVLAVWAAGIVVRWFVRLLRKDKTKLSRNRRILQISVLALALIELLCFLYAWRVEPYWPEVTDVPIEIDGLDPAASPIRIIHLSDLHCDAKARLEPELPGLLRRLHPNLIVFTGDAINHPEGLENFQTLMRELTAIAPVYAVSGNWDYFFDSVPEELYRATEVRFLRNSIAKVEIGSSHLWLVGIDETGHTEAASLLGQVPQGEAAVVLCHRPDLAPIAAQHGARAFLCGHTHGGQLALPEYGALVTLSKYGKRFGRGRVELEDMTVYINRGIGMEGGFFPRLRFCSRPEIALIRLVPGASAPEAPVNP